MQGKKSYKRELAIVLLLWLVYLTETKDANIIEIFAWPILAGVFGVFGLDFWVNRMQSGNAGTFQSNRVGDQRRSQYPARPTEQSDPGDK